MIKAQLDANRDLSIDSEKLKRADWRVVRALLLSYDVGKLQIEEMKQKSTELKTLSNTRAAIEEAVSLQDMVRTDSGHCSLVALLDMSSCRGRKSRALRS